MFNMPKTNFSSDFVYPKIQFQVPEPSLIPIPNVVLHKKSSLHFFAKNKAGPEGCTQIAKKKILAFLSLLTPNIKPMQFRRN